MIKTWQERKALSNGQWPDDECMKAEIDELREALKDAESGPLSDEAFDIVTSENQVLKAKLAALEVLYLNSLADATQWQLYKSRKDAVIAAGMGKKAMRDSAAGVAPVPRMTGAALASQEPVAEVLLVDGEKVIDASMAFFDSVELGTKLYLAAGAAPTDAWKDAVLDALANHALDAPLTDTPRQIVKKLIDMVAMMARDPAINAGAAPAAKVPEEPRIDINDLSGMIAAVIKDQP